MIDFTENQDGHCLIDFTIEAKFCINNERISPQNNSYTSVSGKGKSVVDYILISHDALSTCKHFDKISCNEFVSKHDLSNQVVTVKSKRMLSSCTAIFPYY